MTGEGKGPFTNHVRLILLMLFQKSCLILKVSVTIKSLDLAVAQAILISVNVEDLETGQTVVTPTFQAT